MKKLMYAVMVTALVALVAMACSSEKPTQGVPLSLTEIANPNWNPTGDSMCVDACGVYEGLLRHADSIFYAMMQAIEDSCGVSTASSTISTQTFEYAGNMFWKRDYHYCFWPCSSGPIDTVWVCGYLPFDYCNGGCPDEVEDYNWIQDTPNYTCP